MSGIQCVRPAKRYMAAISAAAVSWSYIMNVISFEQRTPEWLNWKKQGIGASESGSIAAATGLLPQPAAWMDTIQELWEKKVGLRPSDKLNPAMMRGVAYEDEAVAQYRALTGHMTSPMCGEMDDHPFVQASFDGSTFDMGVILETKIPGQSVMDLAAQGEVVPYYQPQCAQHCLVAWGHPDQWPQGAEHHFYAYQPENNKGFLVVRRADQYKTMAAKLLPSLQAFWKNVQEKLPPCGDAWLQAAIKYRIALAALEEAKAAEEAAKDVLMSVYPAGEVKTFSGGGVTITKSQKAGSISYAQYVKDAKIPEADLEKYRGKTSSTVRVTVNDKTPMPDMSEAVKLALGDSKQDVVSSATSA